MPIVCPSQDATNHNIQQENQAVKLDSETWGTFQFGLYKMVW